MRMSRKMMWLALWVYGLWGGVHTEVKEPLPLTDSQKYPADHSRNGPQTFLWCLLHKPTSILVSFLVSKLPLLSFFRGLATQGSCPFPSGLLPQVTSPLGPGRSRTSLRTSTRQFIPSLPFKI